MDKYQHFFKLFENTSFYKRVRKDSAADLKKAMVFMELNRYLANCQSGLYDEQLLSDRVTAIFLLFAVTDDERAELNKCINQSGVDTGVDSGIFIPDPSWISTHSYDFDNDCFYLTTAPHASWVRDYFNERTDSGGWKAPLPYPTLTDEQAITHSLTDGGYYVWDEDAHQADNTTGWVPNPNLS